MDGKNDSDQKGFKYIAEEGKKKDQAVQPAPDDHFPPAPIENGDEPLFNWSAPDSFSVSKSAGWYLALLVITLVIAAAIYFLTKDKITTTVIVVSGLLVGFYGAKKPKMVHYQLTRHGFTINGRYYGFGSYRSFAIVYHGDGRSAVLTPLKRFMPYMYIYFERDMEQPITAALTDVLPKETAHNDAIDKILRQIGF